jgi:hypothetical protein
MHPPFNSGRRIVDGAWRRAVEIKKRLRLVRLALRMSQLPNSVENMSPGNYFIRTLADSAIDPRVTAHSIIAVLGDGPITGKTDGVVAYESAHIDGVASELVVRSGHSTQSHPETIEEVRRILREHAGVR